MSNGPAANILTRLTFNKGLRYNNYPAERIKYIYDKSGNVTGFSCNRFELLTDDILLLNQPATRQNFIHVLDRQFQKLFADFIGISYNSTTCLLKAALAFHQLLQLYNDARVSHYKSIVAEALLTIFREVEMRTKRPYYYQISSDEKDLFKPLPVNILSRFPLNQHHFWSQQTLKNKPHDLV